MLERSVLDVWKAPASAGVFFTTIFRQYMIKYILKVFTKILEGYIYGRNNS